MRIFAHRGNLEGRCPDEENNLNALRAAVSQGFDVEFDVNFSPDRSHLVLAHDERPWEPQLDVEPFLSSRSRTEYHALNVKHVCTLLPLVNLLGSDCIRPHFFLFDFELLIADRYACRYMMRALQDRGMEVAYRLSEREPFVAEYAKDDGVHLVWLDELDTEWLRRSDVTHLLEAGKQVFYVSPELHERGDLNRIRSRWEQVATWGVHGVCTDYPLELRRAVGVCHD